jgi:hypothetical protein
LLYCGLAGLHVVINVPSRHLYKIGRLKSGRDKRDEIGRPMFKILELDSRRSAAPTQVGEAFATWDDALAAVKRHLKRFKVSGRNPEGSYWWTRDADGLRKCWISENKDGAGEAIGVEAAAHGGPAGQAYNSSK